MHLVQRGFLSYLGISKFNKTALMRKLTIFLLVAAFASQVMAQSKNAATKIGCINYNDLVMAMPENDSAARKVELRSQEYSQQLEELQVEFNQKYEKFLLSRDSLTPLVRKTKEDQLNQMRVGIQNFNASADQELQRYQQEVYQPVIDKANNAVKEYAKEKGYKFIFDSSVLVYFDETDPDNVLEAVKQKLGITK